MTWLDQKNRPVITTISGEAMPVRWTDPKWWWQRKPLSSLIGNTTPARLLVALYGQSMVFDAEGGFLYEIESAGQLPAGFSFDGHCTVVTVQDRPYGTAFVQLHDVTTGSLLTQTDIRDIDGLLALGLDRPVTTKHSTEDGKSARGGYWHGRVMNHYDPESRTTFLGLLVPTGEIRTVFGKPHAVVEKRWVQVAITRPGISI